MDGGLLVFAVIDGADAGNESEQERALRSFAGEPRDFNRARLHWNRLTFFPRNGTSHGDISSSRKVPAQPFEIGAQFRCVLVSETPFLFEGLIDASFEIEWNGGIQTRR